MQLQICVTISLVSGVVPHVVIGLSGLESRNTIAR